MDIDNQVYKVAIKRSYVMPSNKYHMLDLSPFIATGCSQSIYSMHKYIGFYLTDSKKETIPMSIISNSLDYDKVEIALPSDYNQPKQSTEVFIPEFNEIRLTEVTLNNALTVCEKGLHLSFYYNYMLSRSGHALNAP